jgi:hypothetical protein
VRPVVADDVEHQKFDVSGHQQPRFDGCRDRGVIGRVGQMDGAGTHDTVADVSECLCGVVPMVLVLHPQQVLKIARDLRRDALLRVTFNAIMLLPQSWQRKGMPDG